MEERVHLGLWQGQHGSGQLEQEEAERLHMTFEHSVERAN